MKNVVVIGAGTMGNGIAHVFGVKKFQVHLVDIDQEQLNNALNTISKNLDRMVKKEIIDSSDKIQALVEYPCFYRHEVRLFRCRFGD